MQNSKIIPKLKQQLLSQISSSSTPTLLSGIWPLLYIGRCFGLIPLSQTRNHGLSYSYKSLPFLYCLFCWASYATVSGFAVIIFFREGNNFSDTNSIEQLLDMTYHSHITVTTSFCIYQARKFPSIFKLWTQLDLKLKKYEITDISIKLSLSDTDMKKYFDWISAIERKKVYEKQLIQNEIFTKRKNIYLSWVFIGTYFALTLIGAAAYFIIGIGIKEEPQNFQGYLDTVSDIYLIKEAYQWWSGYYVLIIGPMMEICWAYGDMLIFIFSFTLKNEINRFNKILEDRQHSIMNPAEIEALRCLHWEIVLAVKATDQSLGHITATSFACNILYFFCRVYIGLADDLSSDDPWIVFEAVYAFIYLIGRIFSSAILAAKLHASKTKTIELLVELSLQQLNPIYSLLVERFLQQVVSSNVGLTGNGYFILNWGFVTKVISAIITYEVIILQASISSKANNSTLIMKGT